MEKVAQEAKPVKGAYEQLTDLRERLSKVLDELDHYTFFNGAEVKEYVGLMEAKPPLTAAQKSRQDELKKADEDRGREWLDIAQAKPPTAAQTKRREELEKMRKEKEDAVEGVKKDYQDQLNKKAGDLLPKLTKVVEDVIDKCAKDMKLSVVVSKKMTAAGAGPQDMVLWGGTDITDEVIKRLNAIKQ